MESLHWSHPRLGQQMEPIQLGAVPVHVTTSAWYHTTHLFLVPSLAQDPLSVKTNKSTWCSSALYDGGYQFIRIPWKT